MWLIDSMERDKKFMWYSLIAATCVLMLMYIALISSKIHVGTFIDIKM